MSLRTILNSIKEYVPSPLWESARRVWYDFLDLIEKMGPYVRTRQYCGLTFYYNRGSSIMNRLEKEPIFEEKMCRSIENELRKVSEPLFLDVGVNLGLILAYVVSKVPETRVVAFEPGPAQRALLEMTVAKNNLGGKVTVFAEALGKEVGTATFHTHDPKFVAGDGFIDTGRARAAHAIEVPVTTLDTWWRDQQRPHVSVVKIDTEGAELWILQGATEMLAGTRPVLYMEIEPRNLRVYPHTHLDILHFLEEQHYQLFTLANEPVTAENFASYIGTEDTYIARPQ